MPLHDVKKMARAETAMKPLDARKAQLLLIIVLLAHVTVASGLFIIGWAYHSLSAMASGVHALVAGGSSVLALLSLQAQSTNSVSGRAFLSRFILISLMFLCGLLFLCAWEVFCGGVERLRSGLVAADFSWWAGGLLLASSMVNYVVPLYEHQVAVSSGYEGLARSAYLKEPGPLPPALALGAMVISQKLWPLADPITALLICLMTAPSVYHLARMGVDIIQDLSQPAPFPASPSPAEPEGR